MGNTELMGGTFIKNVCMLLVVERNNSYKRNDMKMCAMCDRYADLTNPQKFTEVQKSV
jgi:hypothetical protein